jgi:hypothetical protein
MRLTNLFLFLSVLALGCSVAHAGPPSHRIKQGPGLIDSLLGSDDDAKKQPPAAEMAEMPKASGYDGVWHNASGRVLLIKQIHRTLFLSGSSEAAAWQAQCVMSADEAKCLGSGMSQTNGEFRYESELHLDGASLQDDWEFHYRNGGSDSGHSLQQH